jgi:hypothetical protein
MLEYVVTQQTSQILPEQDPNYRERLQTHIFTDKIVYRPNDMMFVEVVMLDAFSKTPVGTTRDDLYNYYISFGIDDA